MKKIGIISEKGISAEKIAQALSEKFEMIVYERSGDIISDFHSSKLDGLIFGIAKFEKSHFEALSIVKRTAPKIPIAVIYLEAYKGAREAMSEFSNATVLSYRAELGDCQGIFKKMFCDRPFFQRTHFRFASEEQAAELHSGEDWESKRLVKMVNLSRGGAQLQVQGDPLEAGEPVRIYISLQDDSENRWVAAEVAWTKDTTPPGIGQKKSQDVGLSFKRVVPLKRQWERETLRAV